MMKTFKPTEGQKNITIIIGLLITFSVFSIFSTGCVNQHPEKDQHSAKALDVTGCRLVATSPATADICDKLELDLVGVCSTMGSLPDRYDKTPKIGMAMSPDMEKLKDLGPHYVLSPATLKNDLEPKYQTIGVDYIFLDLKSVDGMYDSIDKLGKKFGRENQAKKLIEDYESFLKDYKGKNKGKPHPRVLILMGLPGSYIVATENSYVGSLVKMAGGKNVYQGQKDEFINVNTEDMENKNPDIIIRTCHAMPEQVKEMFAKEFETNQIWTHFKAVEEGRVYDLDSQHFGMSARFNYKEALEDLQGILYENND